MTKASKSKRKNKAEQNFKKLTKEKSPKIPVLRNSIVAFIVGGGICVLGQIIKELYISIGFDPEKAGDPTTATIIFIAAILTGLGVFDKIAQFCGAGTAVPVTGFANSMVSAALEFRSEGLVLGVGCKMFSLAGTVIVFGTVTAFFAGIIHALLM